MDPLSDMLSLLRPRTQFHAGLDAAGAWSFVFPPYEGIKFAAVLQGGCWAIIDGVHQPVRFERGDCFLLNRGRQIVLSTDLMLEPQDSTAVMETVAREGIAVHNGGGEVLLISGFFAFSGNHAAIPFDALPPLICAPRVSRQAKILRWALDQLTSELRFPQPGGALLSGHLLHLMLVQVLRLHLLASPAGSAGGWFVALLDRRVGAALNAIHSDPARRWTLEDLARIAGLSRTIFAQRFKELVGMPTINYLTRWRMSSAANRLQSGTESIASIAFSLGYESESAFCTAFKRTMCCSPTQYRRQSSPDN
jgi:AraC-like DNA-binding protein